MSLRRRAELSGVLAHLQNSKVIFENSSPEVRNLFSNPNKITLIKQITSILKRVGAVNDDYIHETKPVPLSSSCEELENEVKNSPKNIEPYQNLEATDGTTLIKLSK